MRQSGEKGPTASMALQYATAQLEAESLRLLKDPVGASLAKIDSQISLTWGGMILNLKLPEPGPDGA